jgi:hypothetical protein
VDFLVAYLPPALRLVVAGRADPPLPLARSRARGELTQLRAAQLRFAPDEAAALVSHVAGVELDGGSGATACCATRCGTSRGPTRRTSSRGPRSGSSSRTGSTTRCTTC